MLHTNFHQWNYQLGKKKNRWKAAEIIYTIGQMDLIDTQRTFPVTAVEYIFSHQHISILYHRAHTRQ